jgi:hypothetical protein
MRRKMKSLFRFQFFSKSQLWKWKDENAKKDSTRR